jgi:hypothetical protein
MTINAAIRRWGDSANGGLTVQVVYDDQSTRWIRFVGTGAAFDFLAHIIEGFLGEEDCQFSLEPWGGGCAYFERRKDRPGSGLFLHRQPCVFGAPLLGRDSGFGWLCLARYFEDVPETERDYDPSFVVIDANRDSLERLQGLFQTISSESSPLVMSASEVESLFACTTSFGLQIVRSDQSRGET